MKQIPVYHSKTTGKKPLFQPQKTLNKGQTWQRDPNTDGGGDISAMNLVFLQLLEAMSRNPYGAEGPLLGQERVRVEHHSSALIPSSNSLATTLQMLPSSSDGHKRRLLNEGGGSDAESFRRKEAGGVEKLKENEMKTRCGTTHAH